MFNITVAVRTTIEITGGPQTMETSGGVTVTSTVTVEPTAPASVQSNPMLVAFNNLLLPGPGITQTTQAVRITLSGVPDSENLNPPPSYLDFVPGERVDISITVDGVEATMFPDAIVCLPISEAARAAAAAEVGAILVLLHYEEDDRWVALPDSSPITDPTRICAVTNSFSPFVVGHELPVVDFKQGAEQWLARFGRTVGSQAVNAIGERFRSAARPVSQVSLGGRTLSLDGLQSTGGAPERALASRLTPGLTGGLDDPWSPRDGGTSLGGLWGSEDQGEPRSMSGRELLRASHFTLALGGDGGRAMADGVWSVWGQTSIGGFEGESGTGQSVDGNVFTGYLGADYAVGNVLTGLAVSHSESDGDFADSALEAGSEQDASLTSLYQYGRWAPGTGVELWEMLGYGLGELELKDTPAARRTIQTDIEMRMAALGGRWSVPTSGDLKPALKADVLIVQMLSDREQTLSKTESVTRRLRLALEIHADLAVLAGSRLTPKVELGARLDGGDAESGIGIEMGGGLIYALPRHGVRVEAKGRALVAHQENAFEEWGASLSGQYGPGSDGRGLSLSLTPVWGNALSAVDALWNSEAGRVPGAGGGSRRESRSAMPDRVGLELGYAVASGRLFTLNPQHGRGALLASAVLTPYGSLSLDSGSVNRMREGLRWATPGLGMRLELFGEHTLGAREQAEHRIGFTGSMRF